MSGKNVVVKVHNFSSATIWDMQHNFVPILEKNPCRLILHVGTNNAKSCTSRETLDKLLKLKTLISEKCPQCQTIFSTPTIRSDKAKANLTGKQLTNHLLQLKIDVVGNRNIADRCIGRKRLHLNIFGTIQLAKNFFNFLKKFRSVRGCSGISNLTPEPAHPLTLFSDVASERSKTTAILSDHDIPHSLSRNVNGSVSITCQSLEDNFKDTLKKLRIKNLNRVIISQININSIRNKIELLSEAVLGNIDILMVSETKIDMSFPTSQFVIQGFAAPFRLDRTNTGGGILVYVRDDIPSKLLNISYVSSDTECLAIEINLRKTKWLLICSYNPHKNNISNHLMNLSKIIDRNSSRYDKYLCIGDFNSETSETALRNFCDLYKLKNLVREPTCFKNPDNPSCIDLFLTNCSRSFQDTQVIETGLSDFHKMNLTVLKMFFTKQKHETIFYRNYKKFDNLKFKEALNRELMKHDLNNIDYEDFHEIVLSILNAHAPLKKKHLRANHASFVTKEFRKAVMKKARLRNVYLKNELKQLTITSETFMLVFLGNRKGLILKTLM